MVNYTVMDAFRRVHVAMIGCLLDTESFRSWQMADNFVKEHIPRMDSKHVAIIGDGQKGELKSHKVAFNDALLRACYRHRKQELARDPRTRDVRADTNIPPDTMCILVTRSHLTARLVSQRTTFA